MGGYLFLLGLFVGGIFFAIEAESWMPALASLLAVWLFVSLVKDDIHEASPEYKAEMARQEAERERLRQEQAEREAERERKEREEAAERAARGIFPHIPRRYAARRKAELRQLNEHRLFAYNQKAEQNALRRMRDAQEQEKGKLMNYAELLLHAAEKRGAENPVLVADEWMRARAVQVNIPPVKYERIKIDGSRGWDEVKPDMPSIITGRNASGVEDLVVYSAMCIPTGKCYVGQTARGLEARQAEHYENAYKGGTECPLFYEALRQYPPRNWKWSIIGRAKSRQELHEMEKRAIAKYSQYPRGYNWHPGGE